MKRVLIGDFGAIAALGLRELLEEKCLIVDDTETVDFLARVRATAPDVVVVDSDLWSAPDVTRLLEAYVPHVTVIGCSLSAPTLEVHPYGQASYTAELSPSSLIAAVNR